VNRRLPLARASQSASVLPSSPASHESLKPQVISIEPSTCRSTELISDGTRQPLESIISTFTAQWSIAPETMRLHAGTLSTFVCFEPTARAVTWFFKLQEKTRSLLSGDMQVLSGVAITNCRNRVNSRRRPGRKWRKARTHVNNGKQKGNGMWFAIKPAYWKITT
jgi:hypothetical protein